MDRFIRFPVTDFAGWVGLAVSVVAIMAVVNRVGPVKSLVKG